MTKGFNHFIVETVALGRIGAVKDFVAEFLVS